MHTSSRTNPLSTAILAALPVAKKMGPEPWPPMLRRCVRTTRAPGFWTISPTLVSRAPCGADPQICPACSSLGSAEHIRVPGSPKSERSGPRIYCSGSLCALPSENRTHLRVLALGCGGKRGRPLVLPVASASRPSSAGELPQEKHRKRRGRLRRLGGGAPHTCEEGNKRCACEREIARG